ncbi:MAG TPA: AI-2E family transporter [Thermoanaerobaculia bacterium]|jgi:predicted PurR-regulated permease PerM|nr:AI-2E family transporter [Thermoanaerobaculia bacterium]
MNIRVPFATLLKIALFCLLALAIYELYAVLVMVVVAVLLAVMLAPAVRFMTRHRMRRGLAIGVIAMVLFGLLGFFFAVIVPAMGRQVKELSGELPKVSQQVIQRFPMTAPLLQDAQRRPDVAQMKAWLLRGLVASQYALEALTAIILVLVITLYLLVEGADIYEWLVSFARPEQRPRWRRTADEVGQVILAYMRGQAITCFLCGGVALVTLTVLRVPAALPLAVLAFFCDLIPVVGTIIMSVPAVLLAMMVGPVQAVTVVIVYAAYHLIESYWIIPRIYGGQMRLSTLTVLLSITVGAALAGAVGAVLILPFVAAYPIVERIWLRPHLPKDTVERHEAIEAD